MSGVESFNMENTGNDYNNDEEMVKCFVNYTQAGKTQEVVRVTHESLEKEEKKDENLVIYLTQSNNLPVTIQTRLRIAKSAISNIIPKKNITFAKQLAKQDIENESRCVVDFYHTDKRNMILDMLKVHKAKWSNVIVIIDEIDQGNLEGRLNFVDEIDTILNGKFKLFLVTATIAKLAQQIASTRSYNPNGFVDRMMNTAVTRLYTVNVSINYVGMKYFIDNPDLIQTITYPMQGSRTNREYTIMKKNCVIDYVKDIPEEKKKMTMVVHSTYQQDHEDLIIKLLEEDHYTVGMALNGCISSTKKKFWYKNKNTGVIESVVLDEKKLFDIIKKGNLVYENSETEDGDVLTLGELSYHHLYQAVLKHKNDNEFHDSLSRKDKDIINGLRNYIQTTNMINFRLFPRERKIVVAAGMYASRGITIQSKNTKFIFSSFVMTETASKYDRGAADCQRIGRSLGYYKQEYEQIRPLMIATKTILENARANAVIVDEKKNDYYVVSGELMKLSDIVTKPEWKNAKKQAREEFDEIDQANAPPVDEANLDTVDFDVNDPAFVEKIRNHYRKPGNSVIKKMLTILKQEEYIISTDEMYLKMRALRYTSSKSAMISNLQRGLGNNNTYSGYWKISLNNQHDYVYMPRPVKNVTN